MRSAEPAAPCAAAIAELVRAAAALELPLADTAAGRFEAYISTLLLWRRTLSLTSASTATEIVRKHVLDSLPVFRLVQPGMRVVDLGSGAGFPGVPLAIVSERARVSLVESRRKKASFLREVVRTLPLTNTEVIEERAENLGRGHTEPWDLVVSRAVWSLAEFLTTSERLLTGQGLAVAMKGPKTASAATRYKGCLVQTERIEYMLPDGARHVLLVFRKA